MNKLTGFRSNGSSNGNRHSLHRHSTFDMCLCLCGICVEYDNVVNRVIFQCFSPKISGGVHQTQSNEQKTKNKKWQTK